MTSPTVVSAPSSTMHRTKTRRAVTGRPSKDDLVDAGFVLGLGMIALWGFGTSFDSTRFLAVSAVGLVLGVAVAHVANVLRQSWFVVALMVVVTFFLFGGAIALSSDAIAGFVPNGSVLGKLAGLTVSGWKDLLTTLPPVDGSGQLLVLPYLLALSFGAASFLWARRAGSPSAPVLLAVALLAVVILLGTMEPASLLVHGLGFAAMAFLWVVIRRRRTLRVVGTGAGMRSQTAIGAVLLAAALGAASVVAGHLPGADVQRTVLRTYVEPPFDITQYPSPLVGFRKYTEGADKVWDQELFVVEGAPKGALVRMAVLDDYSGTVWSAAGANGGLGQGFRKVGSTIAADPSDLSEPQRVEVTIRAAYAGLSDANAWVPSVGYPSSLEFSGSRSKALAESVRYNPSTGQAIVTARLATDDKVVLSASPVGVVGKDFTPGSGSALASDATAVVAAKATKWADKQPTPWEQLQSVSKTLKAGAYSDGTHSGETQYLPGHGVARTTTFLGRQQLVGNDEQYAATFALMANALGVPARVVMGAVLADGGVVRGQDVHAWVEVVGADGRWYAVPPATFMPDRSKTPEQQPKATAKDSNAADVPPPNSQRPPGSVDATFDTTSAKVKPPTVLERLADLPVWVLLVLKAIGYPALLLAAVAGFLALARWHRRGARQRKGQASRRLAQGWRDYVDHSRDLGFKVPAGLTRKEQSALVGQTALAAAADGAVFGYGEPDQAAVHHYWAEIRDARRALTTSVPRRKRILRLFSVRGLLFRDHRPVERIPKPGPTSNARARGLRLRQGRRAAA